VREFVFEHESQPYCAACSAELFAARCAACGKPVSGRYVAAEGRAYHPEHFICASCQSPLEGQSYVPQDSLLYCQRCYRERFGVRCAVCGLAIEGKYLEDDWGNRICERHRSALPECFCCRRLICEALTGGGVAYQDGRQVCNLCRRTAVDQVAQGLGMELLARHALESWGLALGDSALPVRLVDRAGLARAGGQSGLVTGQTRVTIVTEGDHERSRRVDEILVLYGLPQEYYAAVLAHEYGHAWLFRQRFPRLSPQVEEGFCQLLSWQWLQQQGTPVAAFLQRVIQDDQDPVYGQGFRAAQSGLAGRSVRELASYLRMHRQFPVP
jgi:hypothetical protein